MKQQRSAGPRKQYNSGMIGETAPDGYSRFPASFISQPGERRTEVELLSVLLRDRSTASRVMERVGGLRGLATADTQTLTDIDGIGETRAATVQAAVELGRRLVLQGDGARKVIGSPYEVAAHLMPSLRYERVEHFCILILDCKNQLLRVATISTGVVNASLVHPREVFRAAIVQPCVAIILAHNHPSGDPTPSREDLEVTQQLVEAGKVIGIEVLDHIIVGDGRFVSLKERGLM